MSRLLFCGFLLAGIAFGQYPGELPTAKEIEAYLSAAPVVSVEKDVEPGRTLPWRVFLDNGRVRARTLFKYVDRRTDEPLRHSYRYELAAYTLSRLIDLPIVPPVVEREVEGTAGSLQWYAENCQSERDRRRLDQNPPNLEQFLRRLDLVLIFEALANDECGDQDDTLIHKDNWKICRIDFSGGFRPTPTISSAAVIKRCSRVLYHRLENLKRPVLVNQFKRYLNDDEIDALYRRMRQIVGILKTAIRENGEAAVLFDEKTPPPAF
jgi:hypothetical protein